MWLSQSATLVLQQWGTFVFMKAGRNTLDLVGIEIRQMSRLS